MFRKMMIATCIILALSLLGSGLATAGNSLPTWETVFDPAAYIPGDFHLVHSIEEYKGDLYAVAGDPLWFGQEFRESAGQIFRSPDGKNWEPASELGFGLGAVPDPFCGNNYYDTSWDLTVFQDKLYMLPYETCYLRPGVILRTSDGKTWESVATTEEFGLSWTFDGVTSYGQFHKFGVFNGMLYADIDYYDPVAEFTASGIWRSPNGNPGTWERVINFPGWGGPGEFHLFKGALYVASDGVFTPPTWEFAPEQIWRTFDGVNWEMVVGDGFGNPGTDGLGGFADYKGYLYVGVGIPGGDGGQIWRSQDGVKWESVIMDGFGNPLDEKVDGLIVYLDRLYAYTLNWTEGGSVFSTQDGKNWDRASEPGWGNPTYATTHLNSDQAVFKDELYMGVIGPQGVLLKMLHPDE